MGMTLVEKLISSHSGRERVDPGEKVTVEVDRLFCYGPSLFTVFPSCEENKIPGVFDKNKIVVALDQSVAPDDARCGRDLFELRRLFRSWKIPFFYDLGRGGVPNILLPGRGHVRPGEVVAGMDGHVLPLGVLGALPIVPSESDFERLLVEGKVEVGVPETVRIALRGEPGRWVGGSDLGYRLLSRVESERVRGKAVEIGGETVAALDLADRFALAAALHGMGAACILMEPDEKTRVFVRARTHMGFPLEGSDEDAGVADEIEVECRGIRPHVIVEGKILDIDQARGIPVDRVIIAPCSGGGLDSLRAAALFLRDYSVNRRAGLVIHPGSQEVLLHAMQEGLAQIFIRAGAHIGPPSCVYSMNCHAASAAANEHCLSTGCCPGEGAGSEGGGRISCSNPNIAAVAAIMGKIETPLELARNKKRESTGMIR